MKTESPQSSPSILVLEPDLFVQADIHFIVQSILPGALIHLCTSAQAALELVHKLDALALAVLDVSPEVLAATGLGARIGQQAKAVICLNEDADDRALTFRHTGRWVYLEKPFSEDMLRAALAPLFDLPGGRR